VTALELNAAQAHYEAGRFDEAIRLLQKVLEQDPKSSEAHNSLGLALARQRRFAEALASYQRALALQPDYADALRNIAQVLVEGGAPEEAIRALEHARKLEPDNADTLVALGPLYNMLNRPDLAAERFQESLQISPSDPRAQMGLASALEFQGRIDDAISAYRGAIDLKPDYGAAYLQLVSLETPGNIETLIPTMKNVLSEPSLAPLHRWNLCFALGRAFEVAQDYDQAFQFFAEGCALKRATFDYDVANFENLVERIIKVFDADLFAGHKNDGYSSDAPVFVLGMPRSGTSLVEQILASHSQVYGAGERNDLARTAAIISQPSGLAFPEAISRLSATDLSKLGEAYATAAAALGPGHIHVVDKTPTNFLYVGLIHLILPKARIIHCVRNPLDTCVSCHNLLFGIGQEYSYDLSELGRFYAAYKRLMTHFQDVIPGGVMEMRYEDVIRDQEQQTRRLLEHLELPWEEACLTFHKTERSVLTSSSGQVRQPLYSSSVARWKRYESHLAPLIDALGP
jgi:Flp pilus assembly protein TadD